MFPARRATPGAIPAWPAAMTASPSSRRWGRSSCPIPRGPPSGCVRVANKLIGCGAARPTGDGGVVYAHGPSPCPQPRGRHNTFGRRLAMLTDPPPYRRPPCSRCGTQPRLPGKPVCQACLDADRAAALAHLDALDIGGQHSGVTPPPTPAVPVPGPEPPNGAVCPFCGPAGWLDVSGSGDWQCRSCGRPPPT